MSDLGKMLCAYKNCKIALYGLGIETQKALAQLESEFEVIGLLDGYQTSGELYGKPVISLSHALDCGVKLILVVARPGSCKVIAKKIGGLCRENNVDLLDVRGKNLCEQKKAVCQFSRTDGYTIEELLMAAGEAEAVSVDLFDTLIMRRVLFSSDVIELMQERLREKNINIKDFCARRIASEKKLSKTYAPTLTEIYRDMICEETEIAVSPGDLARMEWEIDLSLCVPRKKLCEILEKLKEEGKEIYIVSDTYYTKKQLEILLADCGISFYTDIFASCEYGTGKTQELFLRLKDRIGKRPCVHIGDDAIADAESAKRHGIMPFRIFCGLELFEEAGYLGLWEQDDSLSNRIRLGMFVANLFNNPFLFETEEKKICVEHARDIGYLFLAPVISDFVLWLDWQIRKFSIRTVWFCARDGYLIKQLYDVLNGGAASDYFLTSRSAAVRAGIENEQDILYVGGMKFSGTLREQLRERFGLCVSEADERQNLLEYKDEILENARLHRKNYLAYIQKRKISDGPIAFFDFVAKGTTQMYLSRFVKQPFKGFYFLRLEEENMKGLGLDIVPFYSEDERDKSAIFDDYYILETMLTSPKPSVFGFDGAGEPCYARETRSDADIACFLSAGAGILDYFKEYLNICPAGVMRTDKKLDEAMLSLIHIITISDSDFLNLKVEDPFFNRMTDITDLI